MKKHLHLFRCITAALAVAAITLPLVSCGSSERETSANTHPKEDLLSPAEQAASSKPPFTLDEVNKKITTHKEALSSAFKDTPTVSPEFLEYEETDGGLSLTKYSGTELIVSIPAEIDGKPVIKIAKTAFGEKSTIHALSIPDSVKVIEGSALAPCKGLTTLEAPLGAIIYDITENGKTSDGYLGYVFGAKSYEVNAGSVPAKLDTLILTGNAATVTDFAFYGLGNLYSVSLPSSTKTIGRLAFSGCAELEFIDIGNSLESIGEYAFDGCSKLICADLPVTVKSIGLGAYQGCSHLSQMTLPHIGESSKENTYLAYIFGAEDYTQGGGFFPSALQKIAISDGLEEIGANAFYGCLTIRSIALPKTLKSIGYRAFRNCVSIKEINLPDSLKTIGDSAFIGCTSLKTVSGGSGLTSIGMQAFMNCSSLSSFAISDGIAEIAPSTFAGCSSLKAITWSASLKKIGKNAFRGCSALSEHSSTDGVEVLDGNQSLSK